MSDDELLSEIAYRPISDWGSTKSKVQSVVRRGIKIWQNRDRMQQGLPTKNGKVGHPCRLLVACSTLIA